MKYEIKMWNRQGLLTRIRSTNFGTVYGFAERWARSNFRVEFNIFVVNLIYGG